MKVVTPLNILSSEIPASLKGLTSLSTLLVVIGKETGWTYQSDLRAPDHSGSFGPLQVKEQYAADYRTSFEECVEEPLAHILNAWSTVERDAARYSGLPFHPQNGADWNASLSLIVAHGAGVGVLKSCKTATDPFAELVKRIGSRAFRFAAYADVASRLSTGDVSLGVLWRTFLSRPKIFEPELATQDRATVDGQIIHRAIVDRFARFKEICSVHGIQSRAVSGYRSDEKQRALFEGRVSARMKKGMNRASAVKAVRVGTSPPGASSHRGGFAIDTLGGEITTVATFDVAARYNTRTNYVFHWAALEVGATRYHNRGRLIEDWHLEFHPDPANAKFVAHNWNEAAILDNRIAHWRMRDGIAT